MEKLVILQIQGGALAEIRPGSVWLVQIPFLGMLRGIRPCSDDLFQDSFWNFLSSSSQIISYSS